jgi:hypothetical protein
MPGKHPFPQPHPHSPHTPLSTTITIPPAAIVKLQGFVVRGFSPLGAARAYIHLFLSHASYHRLTCPIVRRLSRTLAAYHHHGRRRRHWSCHNGAYDPLSATGSIVTRPELSWCLAGHQDWRASPVLPPWGTWTIGPHNQPPHPTPSSPLPTYLPYTHSRILAPPD